MVHANRNWLQTGLILMLFTALVVGHCVAFSTERLLVALLERLHASQPGRLIAIGATAWSAWGVAVFALLTAALSWWVLRRAEGMMERSLLYPPSSLRRRFLETTVVIHRPGLRYQVGFGFVSLALLGLGTAVHSVAATLWSLASGHYDVSSAEPGDAWIAVAGVCLLVGLAFVIRYLDRPEPEVDVSEPGPYAALIMFLSNPLNQRPAAEGQPPARSPESGEQVTWSVLENDLRTMSLVPGDREGAKVAFGRNAWLMPVLSIFDQVCKNADAAKVLRHVVLIVSKEAETDSGRWTLRSGTLHMAPFFVERLKAWIGGSSPSLHVFPAGGADFENPKDLQRIIEGAYDLLYREGVAAHEGILLDLTGGTKHCSLMAGIVSFDPGRASCYVSTSDYRILQYDFRPPKEHQPGV